MSQILTLQPVTRIEGHLALHAETEPADAEGRKGFKVTNAFCDGEMFRGIENILVGRDPLDAQQITQRICGVCPISHALASIRAQEMAYGIKPVHNGRVLQNLILAANYLQSHVLHFYHLAALDFVDVKAVLSYTGPNATLAGLRQWVEEALARKEAVPAAPFLPRFERDYVTNHDDNMALLRALCRSPRCPQDVPRDGGRVCRSDAARHGDGAGRCDADADHRARAGISLAAGEGGADPSRTSTSATCFASPRRFPSTWRSAAAAATSSVSAAFPWTTRAASSSSPAPPPRKMGTARSDGHSGGRDELPLQPVRAAASLARRDPPRTAQEGACTWLMAPRYRGQVVETGALARVLTNYHDPSGGWVKAEADTFLAAAKIPLDKMPSVLGRHASRGLEALAIAAQAFRWLDELEIDGPPTRDFDICRQGSGYGLVEAPQGLWATGSRSTTIASRTISAWCRRPGTAPRAMPQGVPEPWSRPSKGLSLKTPRNRLKSGGSSAPSIPAWDAPCIDKTVGCGRAQAKTHPLPVLLWWVFAALDRTLRPHDFPRCLRMNRYHRRDFLRMGAVLAAGLGLQSGSASLLADGLEKIFTRHVPVLWMQGLSCTGCSVSLLNAESPSILQVLTELISLACHSTVSAAQGGDVDKVIERVMQGRDYLLVLEGSIPAEMPEACVIGGKPLEEVLEPLARNAAAVVAAGTCAAFGGVPSAEGDPTGAISLQEFMTRRGIAVEKRLVNCPGCPVHPSCLVGTLACVAARGYPAVIPGLLTPELFYRHSVHDECPRFHFWEKDVFAEKFGDDGCLFKLGCLGPLSHTTCPRHQWNGGVNWCVRAAAPCTGCTSEHFAKRRDFPFYRKSELCGTARTDGSRTTGDPIMKMRFSNLSLFKQITWTLIAMCLATTVAQFLVQHFQYSQSFDAIFQAVRQGAIQQKQSDAQAILHEVLFAVNSSLQRGEKEVFMEFARQQKSIEEIQEFSFVGKGGKVELSSNAQAVNRALAPELWAKVQQSKDCVVQETDDGFNFYQPLRIDADMRRMDPTARIGDVYGALYLQFSKAKINAMLADAGESYARASHWTLGIALLTAIVTIASARAPARSSSAASCGRCWRASSSPSASPGAT